MVIECAIDEAPNHPKLMLLGDVRLNPDVAEDSLRLLVDYTQPAARFTSAIVRTDRRVARPFTANLRHARNCAPSFGVSRSTTCGSRMDRDGSSGLEVLPEITLRIPATRRIVLTGFPSTANLQRVLKYQVEGFFKRAAQGVGAHVRREASCGREERLRPRTRGSVSAKVVCVGGDLVPIPDSTPRSNRCCN